ncbi:MAG: hypothetical protein HQL76_03290 [Magnetococcales bacterium]|nr:hypothetical protein [Magnetococcales bacterium]
MLGLALLMQSGAAFAYTDYNTPTDDGQFKNCVAYSTNKWTGGDEPSPVPGQSKATAFCTCLWNETPDNFRGGLAKFSESEAGAQLSNLCSKHANWE